jgi:hypothetical protein
MAIILGFLGSMIFVLVVGFGWVYLCKKLLRLLEAKSQPAGLPQYAFAQAQQAKSRTAFKLLIIGGSFLIVGGIVSFFLRSYPTYLIVSWVILIIFVSNILNQELRLYYRIGLEQALTNLQMKTVRMTRRSSPQFPGGQMQGTWGRLQSGYQSSHWRTRTTAYLPNLRALIDTTGYLQALRQVFKLRAKKGDDQHR